MENAPINDATKGENEPSPNAPWLKVLNNAITDAGEDTPYHGLSMILKSLLYSNDTSKVDDAAKQIDSFYYDVYLKSGPLMRFMDDKGMPNYLNCLYEMICDLASSISYNDARQDTLVQLLQALRRLPPKTFKIWGFDSSVYNHEPTFGGMMDDKWNHNYPREPYDDESPTEWADRCNRWVNYSTFIARCMEAGIDNQYPGYYKYPLVDIGEVLEDEFPDKTLRDCKIRVATQYILLCGRTFHNDILVTSPDKAKQSHRKTWPIWAKKFAEISENEDIEEDLRSAATEARKIMTSLQPDLFLESEGGSKSNPSE